jgi:hypothetical protein
VLSRPFEEKLAFWLEYANLYVGAAERGNFLVNIHESAEDYLVRDKDLFPNRFLFCGGLKQHINQPELGGAKL